MDLQAADRDRQTRGMEQWYYLMPDFPNICLWEMGKRYKNVDIWHYNKICHKCDIKISWLLILLIFCRNFYMKVVRPLVKRRPKRNKFWGPNKKKLKVKRHNLGGEGKMWYLTKYSKIHNKHDMETCSWESMNFQCFFLSKQNRYDDMKVLNTKAYLNRLVRKQRLWCRLCLC